MTNGPIKPKLGASFFIGWEKTPPAVDRRFLLAASIALAAGGGAGAAWIAGNGAAPGDGSWPQADVRDWTGFVGAEPYPHLRLLDDDGRTKTALLACQTKCGVASRLNAFQAGPVVVRGSPIRRGRHLMIAVADGADWVGPASAGSRLPPAAPAAPRDLGEVALTGEILDSKCWFGAMRPGAGKPHKACAALCIRSGLPPAFYAKDSKGAEWAFVMTDPDGGPIVPDDAFLALVADPARASGRLVALDDLISLRVDPTSIERV